MASIWDILTDIFDFASSSAATEEALDIAKEQWEFTERTTKAGYESDIATYEYNISALEAGIESLGKSKEFAIWEFGRQTEKYNRAQREAYGASGAVVGVGTPLEEMEKQAQHQEVLKAEGIRGFEEKETFLEEKKEFLEEQKGKTESLIEELWPTVEETTEEEEGPKEGDTKTTGGGQNIQQWIFHDGRWQKRGH